MQVKNFFADSQPPTAGECSSTILRHKNVQIERIISSGSFGPCDYLQVQDEWVVLLEGRAVMIIAAQLFKHGINEAYKEAERIFEANSYASLQDPLKYI